MATDANRLPRVPRENDEHTELGQYRRDLNRALVAKWRADAMREALCLVPQCSGAPTDTPSTAGGLPLRFDVTSGKLYIYDGAAWLASAAFT